MSDLKIESGNWNEVPWKPLRKGMKMCVFATSAEQITTTIGEIHNDHELRPHSHPIEQIALCLEGKCDYYVDGKPYTLTKGSWVVVPPDVEHYARVHETDVPCIQMDIFAPARPDYVKTYVDWLKEEHGIDADAYKK